MKRKKKPNWCDNFHIGKRNKSVVDFEGVINSKSIRLRFKSDKGKTGK